MKQMQQIKNGNGNHRRGERLKDADLAVARLLIKNHHAERHLVNRHNIITDLSNSYLCLAKYMLDNSLSVKCLLD